MINTRVELAIIIATRDKVNIYYRMLNYRIHVGSSRCAFRCSCQEKEKEENNCNRRITGEDNSWVDHSGYTSKLEATVIYGHHNSYKLV